MATDIPRIERAEEALALRARGLTHRQIADRMGISRSYASLLIQDPDGSKEAARKASYRGVCEDCGGPTDGSNGRKNAPKVCLGCTNKRREAKHGTYSRYTSGCRCEACTEANREQRRELRKRSQEAGYCPTHGASGYLNYGCRCETCRRAAFEYNYGHKQRWLKKVRGTEPPRHGTHVAYNSYQCRCEVCRAFMSAYRAERKARQRV